MKDWIDTKVIVCDQGASKRGCKVLCDVTDDRIFVYNNPHLVKKY